MTNILLGTAISDALGVPFESKPADNPLLLSWDGKSFLGSEHHGLKPAQYSDDTQMSLMVAQSLIENKSFNPDDLAARYVDWIVSGRARGYGRTTLLAVQNLQAGKPWSESGVSGSYGNGSSMRSAPFGVFFRNDLYSLINIVKIDSAITHRSDEAEAGALAMALAVYFIVNNDDDDLITKVCEYLPNSVVKNRLLNIPHFLASTKEPTEVLLSFGNRADVRNTVPIAFYCFLKFKNYPNAVVVAIRTGGDTDTQGACTAALCAAKYGARGIPVEWVNQVEDRDKLIILDSQLFNRDNSNLLLG